MTNEESAPQVSDNVHQLMKIPLNLTKMFSYYRPLCLEMSQCKILNMQCWNVS